MRFIGYVLLGGRQGGMISPGVIVECRRSAVKGFA
jgi:hypothetical protein